MLKPNLSRGLKTSVGQKARLFKAYKITINSCSQNSRKPPLLLYFRAYSFNYKNQQVGKNLDNFSDYIVFFKIFVKLKKKYLVNIILPKFLMILMFDQYYFAKILIIFLYFLKNLKIYIILYE